MFLPLVLVAVCIDVIFGVPLPPANVDPTILRDLQCVAQCEQRFWSGAGQAMIDFGKAVQWGKVLGQLETTCIALKQAFACAEQCNPQLNPFKSELIDVTCDPSKLKEINAHKQCFTEQADHVSGICLNACSVFGDDLAIATAADNKLDQFGSKCSLSKCNARCSRTAFSELCQPAAGETLQKYAEHILASFNRGWTEREMETALPAYPQQCHFFFFGQQFFGSSADQQTPIRPTATTSLPSRL
jgi:hypothetical protein